LTAHTFFPCQDPEKAIKCSKDEGPSFGHAELTTAKEPFNLNEGCLSWTDDPTYKIPVDGEGKNELVR